MEYLEAVTAGDITRLLINVPPRSMKSAAGVDPLADLGMDPPAGRALDLRQLCRGARHETFRRSADGAPVRLVSGSRWGDQVQLASDQNVKGEFQNTRRGVMIATSIGGSVTGKGGDRIIVDDLHNPQQAESDAQRETALAYFRLTLATRLDNKKTGAIVVVMQRLHERDLAACCQDLGFVHVCLPAEAETRTEIRFPRSGRIQVREPGDLLWPARDGRAELDMQKRMLGSVAYAGQYQQRPAPAGGAIFQPGWFQYLRRAPTSVGGRAILGHVV